MKLSLIAQQLGISWQGADVGVTSLCIDSRVCQPGQLFVALPGAHVDGHDYIEQAALRGAAAALVSRPVSATIPTLHVPDCRKAMLAIAGLYRSQSTAKIAAITGSCGKTTTKNLLGSILREVGQVVAPVRSFNNDLGVPLTLSQLTPQHQYAVIELGANHPGEIAHLVKIVKPDVATITNCGPAHLAGFGSVEGVAQAKGEIFQGLAFSGTAVLNADSEFFTYWRGLINHHSLLSFGIHHASADIKAQAIQMTSNGAAHFELITPKDRCPIRLALLGEHQVYNALVAAACAYAMGVSLDAIQAGLEKAEPEAMRMQRKQGLNGAVILDDSYNANPLSVKAALQALARYPGKRTFVLGDMGELGEYAAEFHREIGNEANRLKIDRFYGCGVLSRYAVEAFSGEGGYFTDQESLAQTLKSTLQADMTILIKGSRSARMERVVAALLERVE